MSDSTETLPLNERLALLDVLRGGFVLIALGCAVTSPDLFTVGATTILRATGLYVAVVATTEVARRWSGARAWATATALLMLDAVFLMALVMWSGGSQSAFLGLCYLDVVSVTLLTSYRTGLKIALWFALLLWAVSWIGTSGYVDGAASSPTNGRDAATVGMFLLFALATALFSSFNEKALRRKRRYFRDLSRLGTVLQTTNEPGQISEVLARHLCDTLGCERVVVAILADGPTCGVMAMSETSMFFTTDDELGAHEFLDPGAAAGAVRSQSAQFVDMRDAPADPITDLLLPNPGKTAIVPMMNQARVLGLVLAEWDHRVATIPRVAADVLAESVTMATLALSNAHLLREVLELAARDPLTGLANRRVFEDALRRELAQTRRNDRSLSLMLLDVDVFKEINDNWGHPTGDLVLRRIADVLTTSVRGGDVVARLGGDEFALLLPDSDADAALASAERIRDRLAEQPEPSPTMSVGIAGHVAQTSSDSIAGDNLLARADAALYEAKRAGRDRVVVDRAPAVATRVSS